MHAYTCKNTHMHLPACHLPRWDACLEDEAHQREVGWQEVSLGRQQGLQDWVKVCSPTATWHVPSAHRGKWSVTASVPSQPKTRQSSSSWHHAAAQWHHGAVGLFCSHLRRTSTAILGYFISTGEHSPYQLTFQQGCVHKCVSIEIKRNLTFHR